MARSAPCPQCVLAPQCPLSLRSPHCQAWATPRSHPRGSLLLLEGERATTLLFVKSGLLAIRQTGPDGVDRAIAVVGPGFLLGQAPHKPSLISAQALVPVSLCELPATLLRRPDPSCSPEPGDLEHYADQSIAALAAWSHLMRMPGLTQRLASALRLIAASQSRLSVQLPSQTLLAELLCVTRESINRVWREFEARGVVSRRHGHAVDLDLCALARLSQQPGRRELPLSRAVS